MLVLKSTHEALLKLKDDQIAQLRNEVGFLRSMIQPPASEKSFFLQTEANAVLDGQQDQIDISETPESDDVIRERDRLLAGTY
jgi:hypothetical protein